ncbi:MAG: Rad3-related helicase [Bacillus sp. (in: firmicutes)]|jgi:ATP-dependent DNA helicase DinG|uniref:ATP-dependent DNA helicase n=1 Tax=Bacillus sp. 1NLA3E TaxID=666686 RepID=UPI000247F4B5|nr:ATP-dependent DNA helicase [Bacillus sp. 1NLA3E]AGK54653.1 Rad3-related DNA helicase [Bacillus sp. 1NLA3E]MDF2903054.1 Rad3-related helicase [Bacillus sp. (in: firmicutes)]
MELSRLPFTLTKTESFYDRLNDWIGDVFYDLLPEAGFELRDEQIYMAFQVEKAFKEKKVMFAEAGVGTGKTFVYLLYALCYARYTNKPAIIACADETLIEQLVKKEGDIAKLEKALGLTVDVRLAKSRDQYICLNKLDASIYQDQSSTFSDIFEDLPSFVHSGASMQSFHPYGDRKDYSDLTDEQWGSISWDSLQDCFSCEKRQRCGQTLHRDYYRSGGDLIICSQDFYMEHIWTKESRKREGQLPLLPDGSCVVFDEGHLLEYASQKALTFKLTDKTLETLLEKIAGNDIREKTLYIIESAISLSQEFFTGLTNYSKYTAGSEKKTIIKSRELLKLGSNLLETLQSLEEELVFESELFVINEYDLKIVEEYLEQMTYSLSLFLGNVNGITWLEENDEDRTLVIMPRLVKDIMKDEVFSQEKPFIFSSATLSESKSFEYMANSLGIEDYLSFSVQSPFDYEENMKIHLTKFEKDHLEAKALYILNQLTASEGGSLVLFSNKAELSFFKEYIDGKVDFPVYFEGDAEMSTLVSHFQNETHSALCSVHLWEGLDIPGASLQNVMIFSLPFPPMDPVFTAKREGTKDPFHEVDLPYMLLRLRQGVGRLVRTSTDEGEVHILIDDDLDHEIVAKIKGILPVAVIEN